jgi:esterase/lipase superfamily enzyme
MGGIDIPAVSRVLRDRCGAETVHILAHSIGGRLVPETMASIARPLDARSARLRQLVFAAPDIAAATFKDLAAALHEKVERVTRYASSDDLALYGDNRSVLADLFEVIRRGSPPEERFGLVRKERYGSRYSLFNP